jgi:hypothetical protein
VTPALPGITVFADGLCGIVTTRKGILFVLIGLEQPQEEQISARRIENGQGY